MLMAMQCREWRCLPNAGGLYDQDPLHIAVMSAHSAALAEKQKRDQPKSKPGKRGRH